MSKVLLCPIHVCLPYTKCVSFQHKPKRFQGGHVWDGGLNTLEAPFDVNECIFLWGLPQSHAIYCATLLE